MEDNVHDYFWERLRGLLTSEESETLEFKRTVPDPRVLAREITALANTKGGFVILGIDENRKIVGIDAEKAKRAYQNAEKLVAPQSIGKFYLAEIDGRNIGVVEIPTTASPLYNTLPSGAVYQRSGARTVPISASHIVERFKEFLPSENLDVTSQVAKLAITIETLNTKLEESNSWKSKARDMMLGGIIGAVISLVLTALLSLM